MLCDPVCKYDQEQRRRKDGGSKQRERNEAVSKNKEASLIGYNISPFCELNQPLAYIKTL
jgi:hypothetical protein